MRAEPSAHFGFRYEIDFAHPTIGRQLIEVDRLTPERFAEEIAPARTFGFLQDLEALRREGLSAGANLENTLVFDEAGVVNDAPLRFPDECVRHKAIDLIGDLALLDALVEEIALGNVYISIHTEQFPDGEIRGQVEVVPPPK